MLPRFDEPPLQVPSFELARNGDMRSGAEILWEGLVREGVEVVFGYPGGAIMPAYDAMPRYPIRHVLVRHEQGASHMADGYARASGRVGVCVSTSGPGATNLVTGLATAFMDSIPLVAITGQVATPSLGTDAFQETDITGVTIPVTKHNYLVTRAQDLARTLREAFYIARSGRPGPVLVDVTKSAQFEQAAFHWPEGPLSLGGYRPCRQPDVSDMHRALELIAAAERPVILSGHGVIQAGASGTLREFVRKSNIPVAATLLGLGGFPASHPLSLGMMGMHGEAWVNQAIQQADLLIAIGMRFDDRVTGVIESFAPRAKKIHIELDPAEINKVIRVDVALVGDAKDVLEALIPQIGTRDHGGWIAHINELKRDSAARDILMLPDCGKLHAVHVIHDLWRLTRGEAVVVTDVGQHQMWEAQYYKHERPRSLLTSGGLGTMGFALPAAIGAAFYEREREIWVVVGDGGFQMTACELSTCAQEGIKIYVAIINNGFLGMVRQWQEFFFDRRYVATPITSPDFVLLAQAHGLTGLRCTSRAQIEATIAAARAARGTVVIDFRVEAESNVFPMVPTGAQIDEMIRRPHRQDDEKTAIQ